MIPMDPLFQMTKCLVMGMTLLAVLAEREIEVAVGAVAQWMSLPVRLCPKLMARGFESGA
jgi:hypothetical protein